MRRFAIGLLLSGIALSASIALATPGALDSTFGTGGIVTTAAGSSSAVGSGLVVAPDGNLVVAGSVDGNFSVFRYLANGTLDSGFGSAGISSASVGSGSHASGVALTAGGAIVAGGYAVNGPSTDFALAGFVYSGALDTSFGSAGTVFTDLNPAGPDVGETIVLDLQGRLLLGGYSYVGSSTSTTSTLARYSPTGILDGTFASGGIASGPLSKFSSTVVQADGKILATGEPLYPNYNMTVARFDDAGALDSGFGSGGSVQTSIGSRDTVGRDVALSGNKILAAGSAEHNCHTTCSFGCFFSCDSGFAAARYDQNGTLDPTFGSGGTLLTPIGTFASAEKIVVQPDGKIILAGTSNGLVALARYTGNGQLDLSFGSGGILTTSVAVGSTPSLAAALLQGSKLVVAGTASVGGRLVVFLVRYIATDCGNGVFDAAEQCEDGNLINGDGCDANCTATACGNGIVTTGELCDDGNLTGGDGCSATCNYGGEWIAAGSMASTRYFHTATGLSSGKVLVAGGYSGSAPTTSADLYDPATDTWSAAAPMAIARYAHTATVLSNGKVLVAGGETGNVVLSSAELYDPTSNTWSAAGALATARGYHTATLLDSGKVLVAGGDIYGGVTVTNSAELYDPATNTWSTAPSMATAGYLRTATRLNGGKILVAGGYTGTGSISSADLYDQGTNTWSAASPMATARHYHTATLLSSGKVLVAGGQSNGPATSSAELYDPFTNTWSAAVSMASARYFPTATLLSSTGKVLVAGGYTGSAYTNSAELYNPGTNAWSAAAPMITARGAHTATVSGSGRVLAVGGITPAGVTRSAELYDPATCGDGILEGSEQCDDGNLVNGDCCRSTCQYAASGSACPSDGNVCTDDVCNAAGICGVPNTVPCSSDGVACTNDVCDGNGTCAHTPNHAGCADANACNNDVCNPLGGCEHPPVMNGTGCSDSNACTQSDTCQDGACTGTNSVVCSALDQCHDVGTCNTGSGICSNPPKLDNSSCNDGNACTQTDTCQSGGCTGTDPVMCHALDQCHDVGTCNTGSGTCSNPPKPNNSSCNDGDGCPADTCQSGACQPVSCPSVDAVALAGKPLSVTIGSGKSETLKKLSVSVRNANSSDRTITLSVDASDCPAAIAGDPDFNTKTLVADSSVLVPAGKTRTAKLPLTIRSTDFDSFNYKAPARCTLLLAASAMVAGGSNDPTPGNNVARVDLSVVDKNETEGTAIHETTLKSAKPVTIIVRDGKTTVAKTLKAAVGNADYRPSAENPGDAITLAASTSCSGLTLSPPVCDSTTSSPTVMVKGGSSKTCKIMATVDPLLISTPNKLSPQRCTVSLSASGPSNPELAPLDASNNATELVIDVVDKNDF
jgi:uncharacterized delta-60 repeat protein